MKVRYIRQKRWLWLMAVNKYSGAWTPHYLWWLLYYCLCGRDKEWLPRGLITSLWLQRKNNYVCMCVWVCANTVWNPKWENRALLWIWSCKRWHFISKNFKPNERDRNSHSRSAEVETQNPSFIALQASAAVLVCFSLNNPTCCFMTEPKLFSRPQNKPEEKVISRGRVLNVNLKEQYIIYWMHLKCVITD